MKRIIFSLSILFSLVLFGFVSYSNHSVIKNDWTGTWGSSFGDLRLIAEDEIIYGDYADLGVIYGTRVHNGQGGHTFEGTFVNYPENREGVIIFKMNDLATNKSFTGKWTWKSLTNWSAWTGTKKSTQQPTLKYFYKVIGRSFDANWQPVTTDFDVEFFKDGIRHFTTKGTNGTYSQVLPKGMWEIKIKKAGYKDHTSQINVTSNYPNNNPYHLANIQLIKN